MSYVTIADLCGTRASHLTLERTSCNLSFWVTLWEFYVYLSQSSVLIYLTESRFIKGCLLKFEFPVWGSVLGVCDLGISPLFFLKWTSERHQMNSALEIPPLTRKEIWLTLSDVKAWVMMDESWPAWLWCWGTRLNFESDSLNFGQCTVVTQWAGDLFVFGKSH